MDSAEDYNDQFYEYYHKRPVELFFLVIFGGLMSVIGLIGNGLIIIVKFKQRNKRIGLDYFIINQAVMFIIGAILLIVFLLEEVFHEITTSKWCNTKLFFQDFSSACILCSVIGLIFVAKFVSNITEKEARIGLVLIWIAAIFDGYPYNSHIPYEIQINDDKSRHICSVDTWEMTESWEEYNWKVILRNAAEFFIPAVIFMVLSVISIVWKSSNQMKSILYYTIAIGSYWCIFMTPVRIYVIIYHYIIDLHYGVFIFTNILADLVIILNPIVYCFFDRIFYKQVCNFLHIRQSEDDREIIYSENE